LVKVGLKAAELKGSAPRKVALGILIWKKITTSQDWIASRLQMKSAANVGRLSSS